MYFFMLGIGGECRSWGKTGGLQDGAGSRQRTAGNVSNFSAAIWEMTTITSSTWKSE